MMPRDARIKKLIPTQIWLEPDLHADLQYIAEAQGRTLERTGWVALKTYARKNKTHLKNERME